MKSRLLVAALAATAMWFAALISVTRAQGDALPSQPGDAENPPWKEKLSRLATPRTPGGKPDMSGTWQRASNRVRDRLGTTNVGGGFTDERGNVKANWGGRGDGAEGFILGLRDSGIAYGAETNMPLYKPEHWDRVQWLDENGNFEDPGFVCQPWGVPRMGPPDRIVQTPKELFFFYRRLNTHRIIPMNKPLPPVEEWEGLKWNGISSARWDGDTLVIESVDFSENSWLHLSGYFHSADMRVTERMTREGNVLTWQATVNDPVLLEPWVQNPWHLRLENADPVGEPRETLPCKEFSREHITSKERG